MQNDLIVFGEDWGGLPSSTQHLIKHLAQNRQVLWVNSIGLRQPKWCLRDMKRVVNKVARAINALSIQKALRIARALRTPTSLSATMKASLPVNIHVVDPLTIPAPKSQLARYTAALLLRKHIGFKARKLKLNCPILWISVPTAADVVGHLHEHKVIYYCGDDFSGLAGVDNDTVAIHEQQLIQTSDLIIAASDNLRDKLTTIAHRAPCHTLTHGVDFELFNKPTERASDLPGYFKPIAGFYGSLSTWLDIDLLAKVIQQLPHWNFVFIGKQEADMSQIIAFDNTYFLGPKPHEQLPSYVQHWQASMLPFRDNTQIRACNPLKLSEYMAAGTPIVATNFPALQAHRQFLQVAQTAEAFVEALEMSLHVTQLTHFRAALNNRVINTTWSTKAKMVEQWIEQL